MQFIRKSILVAAATLFTVSLFWFIALFGFQRVLGSSDQLKQSLKQSGIYNTVVVDALTLAQKDQQKKGGQGELDISVDDPHVRSIINQAFPPSYLQSQTEGVLDNAFAWLRGNSAKLSFTIDVADAKTRLADGVAAYTKDKAAGMPPCPAAAMPPSGDFDVFKSTCMPPGVNPDTAAAKARDQILQGEFLKDTKLTADSIKNDKGQPLGEQLKRVPTVYQHAHDGIFGLGVLSALLSLAVVFLSVNWRAGLRKVATIGMVVGGLNILLSIIANLGMNAASKQLDQKADQPLQHTLFRVLQGLINDARHWWLWAGVGLMVCGVIVLVVLHVTKPKHEAEEGTKVKLPVGDDAIGPAPTPEDTEPKKDEPAPAEKPPKKTAKNNKVQ